MINDKIITIKDKTLKLTGKKLIKDFRISKFFNYENISIEKMFLSHSLIESINELPQGLIELNCSSNRIWEINNFRYIKLDNS